MGIVGTREIDVLATELTEVPPGYPLAMDPTPIYYRLTTATGDLYWAVPEHIGAIAAAELAGGALLSSG